MDTTSTKRSLPRQQSDAVPAPAQPSVMSASPQHNPPYQQPSYYSTRPPNNNQPDYRSNGAPASTVSLPPIQHLEPTSMPPPQPYHHSHAELPRPHYQHNGEQYHHQYVSQPIPHRYEYQNGVHTLPSDVNGHGIVRYNIPMNPSANSRNKKEVKRRTKTGCLTCRKRRIKCDERHPECKNCEKSKRQCLGYDPTFKTTPGPPAIQPAPPYGSQMIKTEHLGPGYSNYGESPIYDSRVLPAAPLPPISSVNPHAHNMTNTIGSRPHRPPPAPMMSTHNNDSNYGELSAPLRRVGNGTNPG